MNLKSRFKKRLKALILSLTDDYDPAFPFVSDSIVQNKLNVSPDCIIQSSHIGLESIIKDHCRIYSAELNGKVTIDSFSSLWGPAITISSCNNPVTIGKFCSIAKGTTIQEYNHPTDRITTYYIGKNLFQLPLSEVVVSKGGISIGNDVWIGSNCTVTSGVTIGTGAVIGANSLVNKDIPPYAIAGGVPARVIKYRFLPEIIQALLESEWWNLPTSDLIRNREFFMKPVNQDVLEFLASYHNCGDQQKA